MYNGEGLISMQVFETLKNFDTPPLDHSQTVNFVLFLVTAQTAASNHFCNEHYFLELGVVPGRNEVDDVFVF